MQNETLLLFSGMDNMDVRSSEGRAQIVNGQRHSVKFESPYFGRKLEFRTVREARHGLQLQPLWIIPTAAVS